MPAGRPPKPTAQKKLEGTARPDRLNEAEPQFPVLLSPDAPTWLDELAREHWLYHADLFSKSRVMTEADASLLAAASERWSVYRRASSALSGTTARKLIGRTRFGERVPRPEHQIARGALADYLALMREFGAGPASRSKVKAEKPEEVDEFDELMRRKG